MKFRKCPARPAVASEGGSSGPSPRERRPRRRWIWVTLLVLIAIGGGVRAILPWAVRDYVNRTLDRNQLYSGTIGKVKIHLLRGAYSVQDIRISKSTGNVPVPLFSSKRADFAIQWKALTHGRVVGQIVLEEPEINFVAASDESDTQTGAGGPWLQIIQDLFPFQINSAVIHNGSAHFRSFEAHQPVDVYLTQLEAMIDNLGNIQGETRPLVATVQATALAMGAAKLSFKMTLDPSSYRPTFHLALRLLGLDVTKLNDLARAYGKFDFKRGWLDLVIESESTEGRITGYVKPLFRNLQVFSLAQDMRDTNVLRFFWQALVGAATRVLRNPVRDQFGTLIPFTGDASGSTTTDILATMGNLLRNAFVRAYLPRLENEQAPDEGIQFEPPEITDANSPGDAP
jgi:hypothetical protein